MEYEMIFFQTKERAIRTSALEHIEAVLREKMKADKHKFDEILEIVLAASSHLDKSNEF